MDNMIKKYQEHLSGLCGIDCRLFDIRLRNFTSDGHYCADCPKPCDYGTTHLYGCYEAQRWGNKYIYYCPLGFIFVAVSIIDELGNAEAGVVAGPIIMGDSEDYEINAPLPNLSTSRVTDLTEIMHKLFYKNTTNRANDEGKADFLNEIYKVMDDSTPKKEYPLMLEKDLQQAIIEGNAKESRDLLNKLMGYIFFHSNSDLDIIKTRVLELVVLLSRSAIEGGADCDEIFTLSNNYVKQVEGFSSVETLSLWLSSVINRFIGYVFEFTNVKHTDIIYKVTAYIKENYMKKISLDDIANHVYLSKSYLSKLFKDETGTSLVNYINKLRVEKSKILLRDSALSIVDVANLVGFDDQSYFSKVFKSIVGISPGKFKEKK